MQLHDDRIRFDDFRVAPWSQPVPPAADRAILILEFHHRFSREALHLLC
jgi:hypothetical protein